MTPSHVTNTPSPVFAATYMDPDADIVNLLTQLSESGKRIFLITNNSADFV